MIDCLERRPVHTHTHNSHTRACRCIIILTFDVNFNLSTWRSSETIEHGLLSSVAQSFGADNPDCPIWPHTYLHIEHTFTHTHIDRNSFRQIFEMIFGNSLHSFVYQNVHHCRLYLFHLQKLFFRSVVSSLFFSLALTLFLSTPLPAFRRSRSNRPSLSMPK